MNTKTLSENSLASRGAGRQPPAAAMWVSKRLRPTHLVFAVCVLIGAGTAVAQGAAPPNTSSHESKVPVPVPPAGAADRLDDASLSKQLEDKPELAAPTESADTAASDTAGEVPSRTHGRSDHSAWNRYIRGFRRDHNFALSVGASSGTWDVRRFGTLRQRKYETSGVWSRFQYSFHLPLYNGLGYMLGSSFGYHYEASDRRKPFRPVPALMFPGVLIGVVANFSPVFRLSAAFDAYMERLNGIGERDGTPPDGEISVTMEAFDFGTFFDVFYDLAWAVRLEGHYRHHEYLEPSCASSQTCRNDFPVNANFKKDDRWLGLGIVHHLL